MSSVKRPMLSMSSCSSVDRCCCCAVIVIIIIIILYTQKILIVALILKKEVNNRHVQKSDWIKKTISVAQKCLLRNKGEQLSRALVRVLTSHQCVLSSIWVEFVVGSLPCSKKFFSRYSDFSLSSKTNISKLQYDLDYCQELHLEPLARVIAQALPVFDI